MKYIIKINLILWSILLVMINVSSGEVELFPASKLYSDLYNSSDPDYPCYMISSIINRTHGKYGTIIGLISYENKYFKSTLSADTFLELSNYSQGMLLCNEFWRANIGLFEYVDIDGVIRKQDKIQLKYGITHESAHYTMDMQENSDSIPAICNDYLKANLTYYINLSNAFRVVLSGGVKYFCTYSLTSYLSQIFGVYIPESYFSKSYILETSVEYNIGKNKNNSVFLSMYYENRYKSDNYDINYSEYYDISEKPNVYYYLRLGLNINKKGTMFQPYLTFVSANGTGVDLLEMYNGYGFGLCIFP